jgi:hypothetical protein
MDGSEYLGAWMKRTFAYRGVWMEENIYLQGALMEETFTYLEVWMEENSYLPCSIDGKKIYLLGSMESMDGK